MTPPLRSVPPSPLPTTEPLAWPIKRIELTRRVPKICSCWQSFHGGSASAGKPHPQPPRSEAHRIGTQPSPSASENAFPLKAVHPREVHVHHYRTARRASTSTQARLRNGCPSAAPTASLVHLYRHPRRIVLSITTEIVDEPLNPTRLCNLQFRTFPSKTLKYRLTQICPQAYLPLIRIMLSYRRRRVRSVMLVKKDKDMGIEAGYPHTVCVVGFVETHNRGTSRQVGRPNCRRDVRAAI